MPLFIGSLYLCSVIYFLSLFDQFLSPQQPGRRSVIVLFGFFWFLIPVLMVLGIITTGKDDE